MCKLKTDLDILKFAIGKEVEAYEFYISLAERVDNPTIGDILNRLAREEMDHRSKLELEAMKLGYVMKDAVHPENLRDGEKIYLGPDAYKDYQKLLKMGMNKESDSFRRYVELAQQADNDECRDLLLTLAEEEAMHKALFQLEYESVIQSQRKD
ncbi:MAG: ferritin family protein [Sedimentisphaerales bacterium]|nr:ferritin family protein [Sedimentisphaerales bacterium]